MSEGRVFDAASEDVRGSADCTWCGAEVGAGCVEVSFFGVRPADHLHAQRWRDYWNATHDRAERIQVFPARWMNDRR